MPFFLTVITHHDLPLRAEHMPAHIEWLDSMVQSGSLVLSGPLGDGPLAGDAPVVAALLWRTESKGAALQALATDPFFVHGVTDGVTVTEWDPIFGMLAAESGGRASLSSPAT